MVQRVKTIDKRGVDKNAERNSGVGKKKRVASALLLSCDLHDAMRQHTHTHVNVSNYDRDKPIHCVQLHTYFYRFSPNRRCLASRNNGDGTIVHRRHTFLIELIHPFDFIFLHHRQWRKKMIFIACIFHWHGFYSDTSVLLNEESIALQSAKTKRVNKYVYCSATIKPTDVSIKKDGEPIFCYAYRCYRFIRLILTVFSWTNHSKWIENHKILLLWLPFFISGCQQKIKCLSIVIDWLLYNNICHLSHHAACSLLILADFQFAVDNSRCHPCTQFKHFPFLILN